MQPLIALIATTIVDWSTFINLINKTTGRSPTRLLDSSGTKVGGLPSFVSALGGFAFNKTPDCIFQYYSEVGKHVNFTFIMELTKEQYIEVLKETTLNFLDNMSQRDLNNVMIVTGNLYDWREALVKFCDVNRDSSVRFIFDAILLMLEQMGFSEYFSDFRKRSLPDKTFSLELKD